MNARLRPRALSDAVIGTKPGQTALAVTVAGRRRASSCVSQMTASFEFL